MIRFVVLVPEMHEDPAVIVSIFLYPEVQAFYFRLGQESQDVLFQLAAAFARDDLNEGYPFLDRLGDNPAKRGLDLLALIEYLVQV